MATVFEGLIQNIPAIFYRCDYDESWTTFFMNNAIEDIAGYPSSDFIGNKVRTFTSIIHPDDKQKVSDTIHAAINSGTRWEIEYRLVSSTGDVKWVAETGVGIFSDDHKLEYLDGFIQDISERKKIELALRASEQQIRDMAFTDSVTGLANRNLFSDRLDQMILDAKRYNNEFALLFIDLDKFKSINDTYGHLVGDKVLSMAGERISAAFRESDVIARFGGDEFLVIMKNTLGIADIESACGKLLEKLSASYYVDNLELVITGSIGVAICPSDSLSSTELIQLADKAMYEAKLAGKNRYCIHTQKPKCSTSNTAIQEELVERPTA